MLRKRTARRMPASGVPAARASSWFSSRCQRYHTPRKQAKLTPAARDGRPEMTAVIREPERQAVAETGLEWSLAPRGSSRCRRALAGWSARRSEALGVAVRFDPL